MNSKIILAIDDNEDFLRAVEYALEDDSYEVITSSDAKKALDILHANHDILVILVDLKMDRYSGYDFLEEIKNIRRPLKSIVLTGHQMLLSDKEAEELKIYAYLEKGRGLNPLLFTIKSAFNDIELEEAQIWKDLALITTETVHLIGNKISPIRRRIKEIAKIISEVYSQKQFDTRNYEKILRDIEIIRDGAEQAHSIKSDLIDGNINKEPVNIINILVEELSQNRKEHKKVVFNFEANIESVLVVADEKNLRRVFGYLIKNSVQAIEDKNILYNHTKKDFIGNVNIKLHRNDDIVTIDIEDNGCGIKEDDISKICKPFFTTKGADRGSGVGLYFCKRMMEDLEGDIFIKETKVGKGTIMSLKFNALHGNR